MANPESVLNPRSDRTLAEVETSARSLFKMRSGAVISYRERQANALNESVWNRMADLAIDELVEIDWLLDDYNNQMALSAGQSALTEQ